MTAERFEMKERPISEEAANRIIETFLNNHVLAIPTTLKDNLSGIEADCFILFKDDVMSFAVNSSDCFFENFLDQKMINDLSRPVLEQFRKDCPNILRKIERAKKPPSTPKKNHKRKK